MSLALMRAICWLRVSAIYYLADILLAGRKIANLAEMEQIGSHSEGLPHVSLEERPAGKSYPPSRSYLTYPDRNQQPIQKSE